MKKVKVTLKGSIEICEYCSTSLYDEENGEDFYTNYSMTLGWNKINSLHVNDNEEENLIKHKGKYIKVKDYFSNLFSGYHQLPVEIHSIISDEEDDFSYIIELEDDEEFDIQKLQLIKSDYEIDYFPYFILVQKIMYNGKEVYLIHEDEDKYDEYGIYGSCYSKFLCDENMNISCL